MVCTYIFSVVIIIFYLYSTELKLLEEATVSVCRSLGKRKKWMCVSVCMYRMHMYMCVGIYLKISVINFHSVILIAVME